MFRYIRLIGALLVFPLLIQGCGTTLQSGWRDFNAYFNTYYNAKTSFERGVELQENQDFRINPERPIRIHPTPPRAGQSHFEDAIQKSADVIRFHPQSRWVDSAIEMMGRSYFYQQQFFSADQKFVELLSTTSDPEMRQRAILWRGRAALELDNYLQGINYIEARLFSTEFDWEPEIASEVKLILAQLLVERNEYDDAVFYLEEALPEVDSRKLEMKAHFLHGQLLEDLEEYDRSFDAYDRATHRSNPSYDLIYHAERKMGIVARKRGDLDWAMDHFRAMSRDDRHFEYIADIEYEIARTLHDQGQYTAAKEKYDQVLRRRSQNPTREVQAQIYYGLAEIYRDFYQDFSTTAAYFDSSAQQASNIEELPSGFDADVMSRSYGEYSRLQAEVLRLDSLLWLGELSEAEFDSVVTNIREQKLAELEEQQQEQRRQHMVTPEDIEEAGEQADEVTENGFLNHKNPQLVQQNTQAFQAYWGSRPLVDDWRRMEAVRMSIVRQFEEEGEEVEDVDEAIEEAAGAQAQTIELDFSEIPFTEEEQQETRHNIASHEYEIGNVFFTSLAMPDSAAIYYRSVMGRFPDSELAPQAIYSLSELYQSAGDSVQAMQYAMQLVDFYPKTVYAERMADRYMLDLERPEEEMSREDSIRYEFEEIKDMSAGVGRAEQLQRFAETYPDSEAAPEALYRSVMDYIQTAREDEQFTYRMNDLSFTRYIWEQEKQVFQGLQDSVRSLMEDSLYMATVVDLEADILEQQQKQEGGGLEQEELPEVEESSHGSAEERAGGYDDEDNVSSEEVADSASSDEDAPAEYSAEERAEIIAREREQAEEQIMEEMEEQEEQEEQEEVVDRAEETDKEKNGDEKAGPKSTQMHLQEILEMEIKEPDLNDLFPYEGALWDSARVALITMRNEYPDFAKTDVVDALADEIEVDRIRAQMVDTDKVYSCNELDTKPEIEGGIDSFISESGFQGVINEHQMSGTVDIEVLIGKDGTPEEVRTEEEMDEAGIMESLLDAVQSHMRFSIPEYTGVEVSARCEYAIHFDSE